MKLQIDLSDPAAAELDARCEPGPRGLLRSHATEDALSRYFLMLALCRQEIAPLFSPAECGLLCDSCNGTMFETWSFRFLVEGVSDSINLEQLDDKWGVDGVALIEKLRGLSVVQTAALVDAIERFWLESRTEDENPFETLLTRPSSPPISRTDDGREAG